MFKKLMKWLTIAIIVICIYSAGYVCGVGETVTAYENRGTWEKVKDIF